MKVKLLSHTAYPPSYATDGAAALDLRASASGSIRPGCTEKVRTDVAVQIPYGHFGLLNGRSGLLLKHGVHLHQPGIIDSDYRGEVGVYLHNHNRFTFTYEEGDRIAQLLILPVAHVDIEVCTELEETARGTGGFGSTGVK